MDKSIQDINEDKLNLMNYLLKHWSFKSYNPKGNYWNISFTIHDAEIMNKLNHYLDKDGTLIIEKHGDK